MTQEDNHGKYITWIKENYEQNYLNPEKINKFISPDESGLSLSVLERAFIYVAKGFPLMLNGGTGTGKTTLIENLSLGLEVPYYRKEGDEKLTLDKALVIPRLINGESIMYPAELTLAAIFGGLFFLEECANIGYDKMVEFHSVFQYKQLNVPTHFGNVQFNLQDIEGFRVVAAGNFDYHRPNFTDATLQRFAWINLPYLSNKQFSDALNGYMKGESRYNTTSTDIELRQMQNKFKEIYPEILQIPEQQQEGLIQMLTNIKRNIKKNMPDQDQNMACYKRAVSCYSPHLNINDFHKIFCETAIYPITAKVSYMGGQERVKLLEDTAYNEMVKYDYLFKAKQSKAKNVMNKVLHIFDKTDT